MTNEAEEAQPDPTTGTSLLNSWLIYGSPDYVKFSDHCIQGYEENDGGGQRERSHHPH